MKNLLSTSIAIIGFATITMAQVPSYVPTNGLVGWWPFNGNANDESGNGNNGTISNGANYAADRNGIPNSSMLFPGLLNLPVAMEFSNNEWTFSIWVRKDANLGHNPIQICEMNGSVIANFGFTSLTGVLNLDGEPRIYASNSNCGALYSISECTAPSSTWIHIAYVYNNNEISIYRDGVLCSVNQFNSGQWTCIVSNMALWIGGDVGGGAIEYFTGSIDDIGLWDSALESCEIMNLYEGNSSNCCTIDAITTQPMDITVPLNGSAMFTTSTSVPSPAYQWQMDNGTGFVDLTNAGQFSGVNTNMLTVSNVTLGQNNTLFRCIVVENSNCSDTTNVAALTVNNNVGIDETSQDNLFYVFPNPAQSLINVKADSKLIGTVYSIYDNTGRVVLTGKLNSQNTTIELGNLPGGIYMFSVGENMKQTFKIIKAE